MNEQCQEWLTLYLEIIWDADLMASRGFQKKAAELYAKAEGMREALECFGYTVEEQYNDMLCGNEIVIVKG